MTTYEWRVQLPLSESEVKWAELVQTSAFGQREGLQTV